MKIVYDKIGQTKKPFELSVSGVKLEGTLAKSGYHRLGLEGNLSGQVELFCDRCGDMYHHDMKSPLHLTLSDEVIETKDDLDIIEFIDGVIDLEFIIQSEIASIRRLLQGSIGFDMQRGDVLEVITIPFTRSNLGVIEEVPLWEQPWFFKTLKLVMGALVIMILIIFVISPMMKRLIHPEQTPDDYGEKSLDSHIDLGDETMDMLTSEFDAGAVGFAPDGSLQLPDLHRDEDVLKAVRALVANEPELSSQVVKSWLNEDE